MFPLLAWPAYLLACCFGARLQESEKSCFFSYYGIFSVLVYLASQRKQENSGHEYALLVDSCRYSVARVGSPLCTRRLDLIASQLCLRCVFARDT